MSRSFNCQHTNIFQPLLLSLFICNLFISFFLSMSNFPVCYEQRAPPCCPCFVSNWLPCSTTLAISVSYPTCRNGESMRHPLILSSLDFDKWSDCWSRSGNMLRRFLFPHKRSKSFQSLYSLLCNFDFSVWKTRRCTRFLKWDISKPKNKTAHHFSAAIEWRRRLGATIYGVEFLLLYPPSFQIVCSILFS